MRIIVMNVFSGKIYLGQMMEIGRGPRRPLEFPRPYLKLLGK